MHWAEPIHPFDAVVVEFSCQLRLDSGHHVKANLTTVSSLPLDEAIAWVERRATAPEPLARLAAGVELADELRNVSEELVGSFVARAREADCSWADIGAAFGVSRQAAQQRFTPAANRPAPWPEHFADDAQAAIAAALDEMHRFRHNYLGTEHILFGLVSHEQTLASTALRRLGLSKNAVRRAIEEIIGYGETPTSACHGIAPRVKRSLERARREARNARHSCARAEHLLLAIATSDGVATQILQRHGIDEAALRDQLAQLLPDAPEVAAAVRQGPRRRRLRR
jgi:hypothetical protein